MQYCQHDEAKFAQRQENGRSYGFDDCLLLIAATANFPLSTT